MTTKYEKGLLLHNKLHGGHTGQALLNEVGKISTKLNTMCLEWVYGDILQDPALDIKTRELTIIACLVGQNADAEIKAHIEAALIVGVKKEQIIALFEQLAIYVGFPAANNAMLIAKNVFSKEKSNKAD